MKSIKKLVEEVINEKEDIVLEEGIEDAANAVIKKLWNIFSKDGRKDARQKKAWDSLNAFAKSEVRYMKLLGWMIENNSSLKKILENPSRFVKDGTFKRGGKKEMIDTVKKEFEDIPDSAPKELQDNPDRWAKWTVDAVESVLRASRGEDITKDVANKAKYADDTYGKYSNVNEERSILKKLSDFLASKLSDPFIPHMLDPEEFRRWTIKNIDAKDWDSIRPKAQEIMLKLWKKSSLYAKEGEKGIQKRYYWLWDKNWTPE